MKERFYVKDGAYSEELHKFWSHLLHNLPGISIIKENEHFIQFLTDDIENEYLQFLTDCDMGIIIKDPVDLTEQDSPRSFDE